MSCVEGGGGHKPPSPSLSNILTEHFPAPSNANIFMHAYALFIFKNFSELRREILLESVEIWMTQERKEGWKEVAGLTKCSTIFGSVTSL